MSEEQIAQSELEAWRIRHDLCPKCGYSVKDKGSHIRCTKCSWALTCGEWNGEDGYVINRSGPEINVDDLRL